MRSIRADGDLPMAMIESGDLLAWSGNNRSTWSNTVIKTVRIATQSDFGHVGIAWRLHDGSNDELFVIEATMPKIRVSRLTTDRAFYCVPAHVTWGGMNKAFLMNKLELEYSIFDAIRAGLGLRIENDRRWQCAELAHRFYETSGLYLKPEFKPGSVVKNLVSAVGTGLYRVTGPGRALDFA